jgi:acyl-homoserine lactone acylase PvdQ
VVVLALFGASCDGNGGSAGVEPSPEVSGGATKSTVATPSADSVGGADSTAPDATRPDPTLVDVNYSASITRTEHGVAHIVADDWGSLGFGQGYAFAEDRACTLIDQVIKVRGERSKWFGPGTNGVNLDTDFAYRHLGLHRDADERFGDQPANITEMITGYVEGFNTSLETMLAGDGVPGWCGGADWVQPITTTDLYAYLNDVLLFASSGVLIGPIATAAPPRKQRLGNR